MDIYHHIVATIEGGDITVNGDMFDSKYLANIATIQNNN
jgi:hypothetical protein